MKYDCSNEFNLDDIYRKLTGTNCSCQTVTACNFFAPRFCLADFQQAMNALVVTV